VIRHTLDLINKHLHFLFNIIMFELYLKLGFGHLLDIQAYDHLLFIIALTISYRPREWKKLLILVTAFTIGHSVTLALAVLNIIKFSPTVIEWLIPITILLTAVFNFYRPLPQQETASSNTSITQKIKYFSALGFGLIHGMGFSNFLRATLMPGEEGQLGLQLLAFNIGIELGQLIIVAIIILINFFILNILSINRKWWIRSVSLGIIAMTMWIMYGLWNG